MQATKPCTGVGFRPHSALTETLGVRCWDLEMTKTLSQVQELMLKRERQMCDCLHCLSPSVGPGSVPQHLAPVRYPIHNC